MISSIKSHLPNLTLSGVSKVETISPPKTINHEYIQKRILLFLPSTCAKRSTPSKSACSIAITPFSENNCSG